MRSIMEKANTETKISKKSQSTFQNVSVGVMAVWLCTSGISHADTGFWQDSFESYQSGASASAPWQGDGGGTVIATSQHSDGTKSLELDGGPGGCWASICDREIPLTNSMYVEFSIRPSSNHSQGCHPWVGMIGFRTIRSWSGTQGYWFLTLQTDSGRSVLGGYPGEPGVQKISTWNYDQWQRIGVLYRNNTTNVDFTYYIGGQKIGPFHLKSYGFESSLQYLAFDSGDGTTWVDDVRVMPPSMAPVSLSRVPDFAINEDVSWHYTPTFSGTGYTFGLSNAPAGMGVDTNSGTLSWTPTEEQGPGTNGPITFAVYQSGTTVAWTNFSVIVNEVNLAPALTVPAVQTVSANTLLCVTNSAVDPDIPANALTFAIVSAPSGVGINPDTGVLTWTPTTNQIGSHTITISVTDFNPWAAKDDRLSVTNSFDVVVLGPAPAAILVETIRIVKPVFSNLTLSASCQLQISSDLINWTNEGAAFVPTNTSMTLAQSFDMASRGQLFFRLSGEWLNSVDAGLVAYYPFNGNFNDEGGRGNHGSNHGVFFTADHLGNPNSAGYFNGVDSYVSASANGFPTADRTVALWFNATNVNVGRCVLGYGGGASFLMLLNNADYGQNQYETQGHYRYNRLDAPMTNGVGIWHHWAVTVLGSRITMFMDGVLIGVADSFGIATGVQGMDLIIGTDVAPSGVGAYWDINGSPFNGAIDEVRIYNRPLSDGEVMSLSQNTSGPTLGLTKAVKLLFHNLQVGSRYQLQVSSDHTTWTNEGLPFPAASSTMEYPHQFDVDQWGQLSFRVQSVP